MKNGRPWRLDVLIPGLLLVALLCDVGCRFVRLEFLSFRAEEAMTQFRSFFVPGPHEPNRHYQNGLVSGDLPSMSNRPEYRIFREQTFTTDDQGFRNAVTPGSPPPSVMMVGTSFTVGGGCSDRQTFPYQVGAISGCGTYNAGGLVIRADAILQLAKNRNMTGGLIIVECLERYVGDPILPRRGRLKWLPYREELFAAYQTVEARATISPIRVIFQRFYKSLQDDRVLPNIYKESVAVRPLRDGQPSLYLLDLEWRPKKYEGITQNIEAYAQIRDEIKAAGFELALVIIPDKLTVNGPLLREPIPRKESVAFLAKLEGEIKAKGIPVVNLGPVLIEQARLAMERGETLYWGDDTHWNPRGIEIAARAVCDTLDLRARCGTPKPR